MSPAAPEGPLREEPVARRRGRPVAADDDRPSGDAVGLCLSGGGYRAMLFHVGALWRLDELGWLTRLERVSSVSGGSITAGVLALNWHRLGFDDGGRSTAFEEAVVAPVRALAGTTVDVRAVLGGLLGRRSVADRVTAAYRTHLFGDATLQDLPDVPRFVLNATNLQTGALWRFSKPYMADHTVGLVSKPDVPLATAVAASSAFPPVLSPVRLAVDPASFEAGSGGPLNLAPYNSEVLLSDGGVYDNLGLETAWKRCGTILVSDGGGRLQPQPTVASGWARQAVRVNGVIDHQVRNLRKRQLVAAYLRGDRAGAYWGIRTPLDRYAPLDGCLPCPPEQTTALAAVPTRLKRMTEREQERLVNWGYAVCDAAMRRHVEPADPPAGFPYPRAGVG